MGNLCATGSPEDNDARTRNRVIDEQIKDDKSKLRNEVKLLLLGAGESGKSTIVKQMKIIHEEGFNEEERLSFKDVVFANLIFSMQSVLRAITGNLKDAGIDITLSQELQDYGNVLLELGDNLDNVGLTERVSVAVKELWASEAIQLAYTHANKYQLNDSAKYYFDAIERIAAPDYVPTEQDVLHSRVKTTGIIETNFDYKTLHFRMFDVGGQRSERKKWIHCFESVTAIIFCVALSGYDLFLVEDESQNRMHEALKLFDSICNNKWFEKTSIILFLNKTDLFKEKITKVPLGICFPDYTGLNNYTQACEYIKNQFEAHNRSDSKQVYTQYTCATDTDNIKFVFNAVTDIIIQKNLRDCGLL